MQSRLGNPLPRPLAAYAYTKPFFQARIADFLAILEVFSVPRHLDLAARPAGNLRPPAVKGSV